MSRVDEALRKASAGAVVDVRTPGATGGLPPLPDASVFEQYPRGATTPAVDRFPLEHAGPSAVPSARRVEHPAAVRYEGSLAGKLVVSHKTPSVFVEQYRRLAAALHEVQQERGLRSVMVTSAVPKEGKTLTAINLALTLSESYQRRVLLIDADLRRPSLHAAFELRADRGLSEVLRSEDLVLPFHRVSEFLSVLPAGGRDINPIASLSSSRMQRLLEQAAAEFEWILLDTPPVGIMPDAAVLAGITDATLFVILAGSTPYALAARAMDELGRERIMGTVLNRIEDHNIPATGYYREYGDDLLSKELRRGESSIVAE